MEKKYHNWHKKFFNSLYLEVQAKTHSNVQTIEQSKFIIDVLKLSKKDHVLDVPCGNGRITNELSKRGFNVTGVDNNVHLLKLAMEKSKKDKLSSKFLQNEMYEINFENEFDAAICFWGSFGYFDDKTNSKFLNRVYKALKPGGKFLIDTNTVETILSKFTRFKWEKVGEIFLLDDRYYDPFTSRFNVNWTIIKHRKIENKISSIRLYTYHELVDLLKKIGFKSFSAYGSIKKEEFDLKKRLYLIARK